MKVDARSLEYRAHTHVDTVAARELMHVESKPEIPGRYELNYSGNSVCDSQIFLESARSTHRRNKVT